MPLIHSIISPPAFVDICHMPISCFSYRMKLMKFNLIWHFSISIQPSLSNGCTDKTINWWTVTLKASFVCGVLCNLWIFSSTVALEQQAKPVKLFRKHVHFDYATYRQKHTETVRAEKKQSYMQYTQTPIARKRCGCLIEMNTLSPSHSLHGVWFYKMLFLRKSPAANKTRNLVQSDDGCIHMSNHTACGLCISTIGTWRLQVFRIWI